MPRIKDDSSKSEEIKRRRLLVEKYYLRRFSIEEIASKLDVSEKTIDRDLVYIREKNSRRFEELLTTVGSVQTILIDRIQLIDEIIRELWVIVHSPSATHMNKIKALRDIQEADNQKVVVLQSVELIPSKTTHIQNESIIPFIRFEQNGLAHEFNEFIRMKYQKPKNVNVNNDTQ